MSSWVTLQSTDGVRRRVKVGVSWTGLFFGGFVYLFRGMIFWGIVALIVGYATFGLLNLLLFFIINEHTRRWYEKHGWRVDVPKKVVVVEDERRVIEANFKEIPK